MTILNDDALEFARLHITKYYDSDFFPKPREFEALWFSWDEVKNELFSKNIYKFWVTPPRVLPAPKPSGDFRVVHQLEPLESIIYTALAYTIAPYIEAARPPVEEKIACSYRLNINDGSFFSGGSGYADFLEQTESLAGEHQYVLVTDVVDFYNQIYLHRLNNAVEYANASLKAVGDDIENFIRALNSKSSQGIPVGSAASVVMAEAVLIDVDNFLMGQGVHHTRYVDDFRIFCNSFSKLKKIHQELTLYLYNTHRLTLSGIKTYIKDADEFVAAELHNKFAEEKFKLFESLEVFNPYTEASEIIEIEIEDQEILMLERASQIINYIIEHNYLDLGLARSAIRGARQFDIADLAELIVPNFALFAPVVNDIALYLAEISDQDFIDNWRTKFGELAASGAFDDYMVRFWMEWYFSEHIEYLTEPKIREFVHGTPFFVNRAKAAITENDLAWVRNLKANLYQLGSWERRALIDAARVLPGDERNHWLKLTEGSSPVSIDRWAAKWVRATA